MNTAEYLPSLYMPMDRWYGLANGLRMPEFTTGTALFADISGFTSLTESLVTAFGAESGLEALALHINSIYTVLIAEVHRYHGSVIGFSGDGLTCWFDGRNQAEDYSAIRAAACAEAMQQAIQPFSMLYLPFDETIMLNVKIALASGSARRLLVGDPTSRLLDVIAGATIQRVAHAEQIARSGEIVIDRPTARLLGSRMVLCEWRTLNETGERFAVIGGLSEPLAPDPWDIPPSLPPDTVRPWLQTVVYDQLQSGLVDFSTELHRTVAVFMRFSGIDYDGDLAAGAKLRAYIHWAQSVLSKYDGSLVNITFGDKGSYLFAAFGASAPDERDATNAVHAAMALNKPPLALNYMRPAQIGVSCGIMQTGSCGGHLRRAYTVLGDDVNLAARLMENAPLGVVLVSRGVQSLTGSSFDWDVLPPIRVKGKRQAVAIASPRFPLAAPTPRIGKNRWLKAWPGAHFTDSISPFAFETAP